MQVAVEFSRAENLQQRTKLDKEGELITTLSFDVKGTIGGVARLLNLQAQKQPLTLTVACAQAMFDIDVIQVTDEQAKLSKQS